MSLVRWAKVISLKARYAARKVCDIRWTSGPFQNSGRGHTALWERRRLLSLSGVYVICGSMS